MEALSHYFNGDLIAQVLVRVDAKTLHRANCVCKTWRSIISDASLEKRFITRCKSQPPLLAGFYFQCSKGVSFCNFRIDEIEVDTNLSFLQRNVKVVASDKGLVLCREYLKSSSSFQYIICNPLTKQWLDLPIDYAIAYHSILFCYENIESSVPRLEFKVVLFKLIQPCDQQLEVDAYSSETRRWTKAMTSHHQDIIDISSTVLCSEFVYFVGYIDFEGNRVIFAYDLNKQRINSLELPEPDGGCECLSVSSGSLYCSLSDVTEFRVWVLVGDGEWSFKQNIDLISLKKEINQVYSLECDYLHHIGLHPDNPDIVLFGSSSYSVFSYNTGTGEIRSFHNFGNTYVLPIISYCLPECIPCLTKTLWS